MSFENKTLNKDPLWFEGDFCIEYNLNGER